MNRKLNYLGVMAAILCLSAWCAMAQEAKPTDEKSAPIEQPTVDISAAGQDIRLLGNNAKYEHYTTPPENIFFDNFSLFTGQAHDTSGYLQLDLNRLAEDDYWLNGSFHAVDPIVSVNAKGSRYQFFFEPAPVAILPDKGERKVQDYSIKWSPLRAINTVEVTRTIQDVNEPKFAGYPTIDFSADRIGAELAAELLSKPVTLNVWKEDYAPGASLVQPNSAETHSELNWAPVNKDRLAVGVAYLHDQIDQDFVSNDASSNTLQLSALAYPLPGLIGQLRIGRTNLDQPLTANGYTKSYDSARLDLQYHLGDVALRGGVDHQTIDHLSSSHSDTTGSTQNDYYIQAKKRFFDCVNFTFRYDDTDLSNPPTADVLIDPRTLYYNDRQRLDYRLDAAPLDNLFLYAGYNRDLQSNGYRDTDNSIRSWVLGGVVQVTDKLSLSADYSRQKWQTNETDPGSLGAYIPDSRVTTATATYNLDPKTWLSATATSSRSVGGSDSSVATLGLDKEHTYEGTLSRIINANLAVSVIYRHDRYYDSEPGMGYRDDQIYVSLKSHY